MSTKEAYEAALDTLEDDNYHPEYRAIDAHEAALQEKIGDLNVANLQLKARVRELEEEVARMEAHNEAWLERYTALMQRIEAAPKVWVWWRQAESGEWFIRRATEREADFRACTMNVWDRIEEVYAVPVGDHIADTGKKVEAKESEENDEITVGTSEWKLTYNDWALFLDGISGRSWWRNLKTGEEREYTGDDSYPDKSEEKGEG